MRISVTTLVAVALLMLASNVNAQQEDVKIGKQNIAVKDGRMTPEALWAMGRIGGYSASPDGQKIVYQVGYYSVKANKSQQKLCIINSDGTGQTTLTTGTKSETDATWLDAQTIAFQTGGEIWSMKADGSDRRQLTKTDRASSSHQTGRRLSY